MIDIRINNNMNLLQPTSYKLKRFNKICFNISKDKNANTGEKSKPNFVGGIKFLNGDRRGSVKSTINCFIL